MIDTVGVTYDALDRMVEQNRSGAYTQFVYSPTGFKMEILNGQTVQKAFVPNPGGTVAVYLPRTVFIFGTQIGSVIHVWHLRCHERSITMEPMLHSERLTPRAALPTRRSLV